MRQLQVLVRQILHFSHLWQVHAFIMLVVIGFLLMFLGQHPDPYQIIKKHKEERQESLMDLSFTLDNPINEQINSGLGHSRVPEHLFAKPKYDEIIGVERSFGYLYMDSPRVMYNRVPKAGSRSVIRMLYILQHINNFELVQSKNYLNYSVSMTEQSEIVRNVTTNPGPVLFERHLHFVDFTRHDAEQPVYINMIQEPAKRLASWYYFIRFNEGHIRQMSDRKRQRTFDECVRLGLDECTSIEKTFQIIPFFCGQDAFCRKPSSRALMQAKKNVELYYAVVGVVDDFKGFLSVLEIVLPKYFTNSLKLYEQREERERRYSATVNKREPSYQTRRILSLKLKYEYEFYYYIKQRFFRLLYLVNKMRVNRMNQDFNGIS